MSCHFLVISGRNDTAVHSKHPVHATPLLGAWETAAMLRHFPTRNLIQLVSIHMPEIVEFDSDRESVFHRPHSAMPPLLGRLRVAKVFVVSSAVQTKTLLWLRCQGERIHS